MLPSVGEHDFINVLDHFPGKSSVGDKFPIIEAQSAAKAKLESLRGKQVVILLGNNVARAFGAKSFSYFSWYEIRNPDKFTDIVVPRMAVVPHPSGINRYWNHVQNRLNAEKFFRYLLSVKDDDEQQSESTNRQDVPIAGPR